MRALLRVIPIAILAMGFGAIEVGAQEAGSADTTLQLTKLLDARHLDAIAAPDPDVPGRAIAALYFPGSQLLTIQAEYPVPRMLEQRIKRGEFRDVYMDLQGASAVDSRFFVQDMEANGLRPTCGDDKPFDIVAEGGSAQITFDGDWKRQGLTEADYQARFAAADARYKRMVDALVSVLRAGTSEHP